MLGIRLSSPGWNWAAFGKHPSFADFISIGRLTPVSSGFSDWIHKGSSAGQFQKKNINTLCSWRFWAKGGAPGELVCGLLKESYDSVGRPYPFVLIGSGVLTDWNEYWELLPYACEMTWDRLENLSSGRFRAVAQLEDEMQTIRPPAAEWSEFRESLLVSSAEAGGKICKRFDSVPGQNDDESFLYLLETGAAFLGNSAGRNGLISRCQLDFKVSRGKVPNSVFTGGTLISSYLALYFRPLSSQDFTTIWSPP